MGLQLAEDLALHNMQTVCGGPAEYCFRDTQGELPSVDNAGGHGRRWRFSDVSICGFGSFENIPCPLTNESTISLGSDTRLCYDAHADANVHEATIYGLPLWP